MSEQLKRRLIGASVLISLAVIFVPMLFEREPVLVDRGFMKPIPKPPDEKFDSALLDDEIVLPEVAVAPVTEDRGPPADVDLVKTEPRPEPEQEPEPPAEKTTEEIEAPAKPKVGLSAWVVQVGSFSKKENALQLVQKLRKAGFDTMEPELVEIRGKSLYRVRIGPEIARENAQKLLPAVKKVSGLNGTVVRYP